MSETKFMISDLENGWVWQDMQSRDDIYLYCSEELEVPDEVIESIEYYEAAFRVSLRRNRQYFSEDWYVNLRRIAS